MAAKKTAKPPVEETPVVEEVKTIYGIPAGCKLNVRRNASLDADILMVLEPTQEIEVVSEKPVKGFYKVKTTNGEIGYVKSEFLNIQ